MRNLSVFTAIACLALPVLGGAQNGELKLPAFTHLQDKATESVDVTLGPLPLSAASGLMGADPKSAEIAKALKDLQAIHVRSYKFNTDNVYSKADLDAVRKQLSQPGWSQLVQTRDRSSNEDVDVYLAVDDGKVKGLAVVTSKPREFTIVNIVGSIDMQQLSKLGKQFHLPGVNMAQASPQSP